MMEKVLTIDEACKIMGNSYDCQQVNEGFLGVSKTSDGIPFDLVLPAELPLNRNGCLFVPGIDCYDEESFITDSNFIEKLGLKLDEICFDLTTGEYLPQADGARPRFRISRPSGASHAVAVIDHCITDKLPALVAPESAIGQQLHIVASWRLTFPKNECLPQDFYIIDKTASSQFRNAYRHIEQWIDAEVIAGDAYAGTYHETSVIYRRYIKDVVLPQLAAKKLHVTLEPELREDACYLWLPCQQGQRTLFSTYHYDLAGVQSLAELIVSDYIEYTVRKLLEEAGR